MPFVNIQVHLQEFLLHKNIIYNAFKMLWGIFHSLNWFQMSPLKFELLIFASIEFLKAKVCEKKCKRPNWDWAFALAPLSPYLRSYFNQHVDWTFVKHQAIIICASFLAFKDYSISKPWLQLTMHVLWKHLQVVTKFGIMWCNGTLILFNNNKSLGLLKFQKFFPLRSLFKIVLNLNVFCISTIHHFHLWKENKIMVVLDKHHPQSICEYVFHHTIF
jgi:hypothetical protein